jgi:predicted deacylase
VVTAAQHGRELNGTAAVERVFHALDPAEMRGEAVFLPVMNPLGVRTRRQDFPFEEYRYRRVPFAENSNVNRAWPGGKAWGADTYAAAVTETAWEQVLHDADIAIDLHGWTGSSLPLVWGHSRHRRYVRAFGLPWHLVKTTDHNPKIGTHEKACRHAGMITITAELTPQNTLNRESVRYGEVGIRNVMKQAGMLDGAPELPAEQCEFSEKHVATVARTSKAGLVVSDYVLGEFVEKGQTFLRVLSLDTLETVYAFRAPYRALVWHVGAVQWGEDHREHAIAEAGQPVGTLKKPTRILRNHDGA